MKKPTINTKIKAKTSVFLFFVLIFCYYFQFPFIALTKFIVPTLIIYIFFWLPKTKISKKQYIFYSVYLLLLSIPILTASYNQTQPTRIFRFLIIFILFLFTNCLHNATVARKTLSIFYFLTYISIIKLYIILFIFLYLGSYAPLRNYAGSINAGDIYVLTGLLKIQLIGNALIPAALIIRYYDKKKLDFQNWLIVSGIILCGNFAYQLMLIFFFVFVFYNQLKKMNKINFSLMLVLIPVICFFFTVLFAPYLYETILLKSSNSNPVRLDQASVLVNTGNIFFGNGYGYSINVDTKWRNYNNDLYFELQTLYIINQVGILGFFLLNFLLIIIIYNSLNDKKIIFLYFLYFVYAFWNPNCWDSTHIIFLILLFSLDKKNVINKNSLRYPI